VSAAWDMSWLKQHQTRMASMRGEPIKPPPLLIQFSIAHALKLPNTTGGYFWPASHAYRKKLLPLVADAVKPWEGRVTITRYSVGIPDPGAVMAATKPLVDLLLVRTKTHPSSMGLIRDDSPAHIELIAVGAKAESRKHQRTEVKIERIV